MFIFLKCSSVSVVLKLSFGKIWTINSICNRAGCDERNELKKFHLARKSFCLQIGKIHSLFALTRFFNNTSDVCFTTVQDSPLDFSFARFLASLKTISQMIKTHLSPKWLSREHLQKISLVRSYLDPSMWSF